MNKLNFNEFKKKQLEFYWNKLNFIEQEMIIFQAQYDDGENHSLKTWDKWYEEYLVAKFTNKEKWKIIHHFKKLLIYMYSENKVI